MADNYFDKFDTSGGKENNPLNLEYAGQPEAQQTTGRFAAFPDVATGVAATARQLQDYEDRRGLNTVRSLATRWVSDPRADLTGTSANPGSANVPGGKVLPGSYVGDISNALGVSPDEPIDIHDPKLAAAYIRAAQPHESGRSWLRDEDLQRGVQMASAGRGQNYFDQYDARPAPNYFDQYDEGYHAPKQTPVQANAPQITVHGGVAPPEQMPAALPVGPAQPKQEVPNEYYASPAFQRIGQAIGDAFGREPLGLSQESQQWLQKAGIFPQEGQGLQPLKQINQALINGVAAAGDALQRALPAGLAGASTAAYEAAKGVGLPDPLARDIAGYVEIGGHRGFTGNWMEPSVREQADAAQQEGARQTAQQMLAAPTQTLEHTAEGQPAPEALPTLQRLAAESTQRNVEAEAQKALPQPEAQKALPAPDNIPTMEVTAQRPETLPVQEEPPTPRAQPSEEPVAEETPPPQEEIPPTATPAPAESNPKDRPYASVPREPTRLNNFLRQPQTVGRGTLLETSIPGGIQDAGGDLKAILGGSKGRPGLINNKTGRTLDDAAQNAWEAGYFPGFAERPSVNDLLDAIRDDHTGIARYSEHDMDRAQAYHDALQRNEEIDRLADQYGIPTTGINHEAFYDALYDRMSQDDRAKEESAFLADERDFEQGAKQWTAYHGTPHEFDQFDLSKVNTGEGAQAYGHGFYFAENPKVAGSYRNKLSKGENAGNLLQVNLRAKPEEILGWYKPLANHSQEIRDVLSRQGIGQPTPGAWKAVAFDAGQPYLWEFDDANGNRLAAVFHRDATDKFGTGMFWAAAGGKEEPFGTFADAQRFAVEETEKATANPSIDTVYRKLAERLGSPEAASAWLREQGIKGIQYLDQGSRFGQKAELTRNVVMFDPRDIQITHRNGERVTPSEEWNARDFYGKGQGRSLQDLENEYRAQEATANAGEHAPSAGPERFAGEHEGASQESTQSSEAAPGPTGGAAEEGQPHPNVERGPLAGNFTIRNDPNQIGLPGTEASVKQAQAARDAGRGTLKGKGPQQEPGGMFDHPDGQGDMLYSNPLFDPAAWRRAFGPVLSPVMKGLRDFRDKMDQGFREKLFPMTLGSSRAQAIVADFANSLRGVQRLYREIDRELKNAFLPSERQAMAKAMDAQSVFEQELAAKNLPPQLQAIERAAFDLQRTGVAGLNPAQRHAVEAMNAISQDVWRRMQDRGLVAPNAQGLPYYYPRQILQWSAENGFDRPGGTGKGGNKGLEKTGTNVTTAGPLAREHLTAAETEAAAQAKFGPDAGILWDIRSLPSRLADAERAIRGKDLINRIDKVGKDLGTDLVIHGDVPGDKKLTDYTTIADHPSFREWTGTGWREIRVAKDYDGPLHAVLTKPSGDLYRGLMMLKSADMKAIMFSPYIHLMVEAGRALPTMPLKVLTGQVWRDGAAWSKDPTFMDQATKDGLAPLGNSGWRTDPVTIANDLEPSRNTFIRAIQEARDNLVNRISSERWKDIVRDPHQALLWDKVYNLQVGIYKNMREYYIDKGFQPEVAGTMAANQANRYAGALPYENLSRGANQAANLLLFSRSFTLGNLGVMKDMFHGAPSHVLARIEQMAGPDVAKSAKWEMQKKAIKAVVGDVALFYMANGLLQAGLQQMRGDDAVDDWLSKSESAIAEAKHNPLAIFGVLPQHWNEPGKQDRVYAGNDSDGRGVYFRLPPGKVGEEFLNWFTKPSTMMESKSSPLVRPILESAFGYDTLGRQLYKFDPKSFGDVVDIAGAIAKHIVTNIGPTSAISGAVNLLTGPKPGEKPKPLIEAAKILGPLTGLAQVSSGYPGGRAAGELAQATKDQTFDQQQAMPAIRDKIKAGDVNGAIQDMTKLNMLPQPQRFYINQTLNPGPSRGALRRLQGMTSETQERVRRQMGMQPAP